MVEADSDVCEFCVDDLCPGCNPPVRVSKNVWVGLAALIAVALCWRGIELLRDSIEKRVAVADSSIAVTTTDRLAPATSLFPPDSSAPLATLPISTSSTSILPPVKILGPLDHPLLQSRPAAMWFWQPSCSLCADQAEFLSALIEQWSGSINFVSVPINGDLVEQSDFLRKYELALPTIDGDDGRLSTFFEVTETPTWGFVFPNGDYIALRGSLGESEMKQEIQALARSAPRSIIDTSSEAEVRAAYQREFSLKPPPLGWSGSVGECNPGSTSREHQLATLSRVNWYRAMAGVDPRVTLNDEFTTYAQAAALTMYASGELDHEPHSGFRCMTEWSYEGASRSNLHLGFRGPSAIDSYIEDEGADNTEVGHRRWILYPELTQIGTGDTKGSNALLVIGGKLNSAARVRERELVMWPPRGYVPLETIYRRWSVSSPNAFSGGAHVQVRSAGRTIFDELVWPDNIIGWPTLVFEVSKSAVGTKPIEVTIYQNLDRKPGALIVRYEVFPID